MSNILICPKCKRPLEKTKSMYKCTDGHCFDIASEGYVNLILANQKKSKMPGDNKEMMQARRDFLNSGAYEPLVSNIISILKTCIIEDSCVVEAGAGEGYYISNIKNAFPKINAYGFDISKDAIKMASKRNKNVNFYVSSSYDTNIASRSVDTLLVVFSPFAEKEFNRILSDNGTILVVKPKTEHLLELKQQFYDEIKPVKNKEYENFYVHKSINVSYNIYLTCENLINLFKMTPFYFNVSNEKRANLPLFLGEKGIKVDFFIEVLKKNKN